MPRLDSLRPTIIASCILGGAWWCSGPLHAQQADRPETVFYVALDGDDAWSGTLPAPDEGRTDGPFATIPRAQEAVRATKAEGPQGPIRVLVRGGTHYLPATIVLGPEDSGTEDAPVSYEAFPGEEVVLSGGRPVTGWQTDDGEVYHADLPEARDGQWVFRQLFVDGRREIQARYPNFDPDDILEGGWLHARPRADFGTILAGIAAEGDFLEYEIEVPEAGTYRLWISYATEIEPRGTQFAVSFNGEEISVGEMPASGGWRRVVWAQVSEVDLEAGRRVMRIERVGTPDRIVHFDAFVLTDDPDARPEGIVFPEPAPGEHQVVVQAECETCLLDGLGSHTIGFQTFTVPGEATRRAARILQCPPGTVKEEWGAPGAEVHIFSAWGWFNAICRISEVDTERSIIHLEGTEAQNPIWEGNRFFVSNVFEELDEPGEWYLDTEAGRLWYRPRAGDPNESEVIAPVLDRIFDLRADVEGEDRVQYITLRGLTFAHADYTPDNVSVRCAEDAAVMLENAWHCAVEDCRFVNIGGTGVRLHLDSRHNRIVGNEVTEAGGNGILLTSARVSYGILMTPGEAAARYAPIENVITHNHVHHSGRIHKYVAGVQLDSRPEEMAQAPGNLVAHNHIHDMPRNGIFAFMHQGGNVYEHNRIERIMLETDDGGGIHIATSNTEVAPSILRHNLIRDVYGAKIGRDGKAQRRLGFGLYLDNATSNCTLTSNVVARTSYGAAFLHGGQNNVVENNILVGDVVQQTFVSNYNEEMEGNVIRRNIMVSTTPEAQAMRLNMLTPETLAECDHNLYWAGGEAVEVEPFGTLDDWREEGYDAQSIVADPQFVDAVRDDYRLRPGSPALELGFGVWDEMRF